VKKKETQKEYLLRLFHEAGGTLTLKDIMQTSLGCEFRSRMHEMRRVGYGIEFIRGKTAMDNTYMLYKEPGDEAEKDESVIHGTEQCEMQI